MKDELLKAFPKVLQENCLETTSEIAFSILDPEGKAKARICKKEDTEAQLLALAEGEAGDHRQLLPVEVELDHRGMALERPGANPRGPLGEARLVHKDDQSSLLSGLFFSAGQVRRRQVATPASLLSCAAVNRLFGRSLKKPITIAWSISRCG